MTTNDCNIPPPSITEEPDITKALLDPEVDAAEILAMETYYKDLADLGYNGLHICVKQCPQHPNEFYIKATGLGVTMHMHWWMNLKEEMGIQEFVLEVVADFGAFVVIERNEETHATVH